MKLLGIASVACCDVRGVRSVRLWSSRRNSSAYGMVLPSVYTLLSKNRREGDDKQDGVTRTKKYADLSAAEKIQADCDLKATNIILQGDDLIPYLKKAMAFLTVVASSRGNNASGQARVIKCYHYQGEGHMARQCTQPKRTRNAAWYKEKAMLAEAQEAEQILDEEQLAFHADPGVPDGQAIQTIILNTTAFQTEDLDTYDSHCNDISNAKAVLMANISNYGSDVISEEKFFAITILKIDLRKFKGNDIVDNAAQVSNATIIAPGMYKLNPVTLAPKDKNNRETHIYHLKHTIEHAAILREIVEQAKSLNPLDSASYYACKHELCFLKFDNDMNACSKSKSVKKAKKKKEWKPTGKMFTKIRYHWRPTGRTFTLVGNACPLTTITTTNKVPLREPIPLEVGKHEYVVTKVYTRRPKLPKTNAHDWRSLSAHQFCSQVSRYYQVGNDQIAKIMGYGDYQIRNITISRVYYVDGLGHNLFSVGQFYDSDLKVAFRKHTIMTSKAQQIKLENGLVTRENRRVIGKCNMRINPGMKLKEPTYQVVLDALALTTCYPIFLITAEVWFSVNVEVFKEFLNIYPEISSKEFDEPPSEAEALSFI
nr:integrase, catalytic region, zinc finger, CCHC-type, peptidase aspartic, catalytic [Tanacetum cinerariifolium]